MTIHGLNSPPQTEVGTPRQRTDMPYLRDVILRAHGIAHPSYNPREPAERKLARVLRYLDLAIDANPVMAAFLGRPTGDPSRNILGGSGRLD